MTHSPQAAQGLLRRASLFMRMPFDQSFYAQALMVRCQLIAMRLTMLVSQDKGLEVKWVHGRGKSLFATKKFVAGQPVLHDSAFASGWLLRHIYHHLTILRLLTSWFMVVYVTIVRDTRPNFITGPSPCSCSHCHKLLETTGQLSASQLVSWSLIIRWLVVNYITH
jgi:hypothetical protein